MLSKNLYKKKSPLADKRRKALISAALVLAFFVIVYGVYSFAFNKPDSKKEEIKIETGDRPLPKNISVYINADKGLSLRKDRDANAERLVVIPNKTKLEATEELDGWYKVTYNGQDGWIAKEFTTLDTPTVDTTTTWGTYQSPLGYAIKYPAGWKMQDYGADTATKTSSIVAFSGQDLPQEIQPGSESSLPIIVKVMNMTINDVLKEYNSISGVTTTNIVFGSLPAVQYTYTSASTGTQMNSIVVARADGKVVTLTETGGYLDDLLNMGKTFSL